MQALEKTLEKIKESIEKNTVDELNGDGSIYRCSVDSILEREFIQKIIQKHMNDKWIPVDDRLPEEPPEYVDDEDDLEECIVMIDGAERPTTLRYAGDGTWWEDGTYYHVVAWQPMPDAYTNQIDKKIALAAAQIIKDYCRQQDCKYCIFGNLKFCRMKEGGCPAYWEITR